MATTVPAKLLTLDLTTIHRSMKDPQSPDNKTRFTNPEINNSNVSDVVLSSSKGPLFSTMQARFYVVEAKNIQALQKVLHGDNKIKLLFAENVCAAVSITMHRVLHKCHQEQLLKLPVLSLGNSLEEHATTVHEVIAPTWVLNTDHGNAVVYGLTENCPTTSKALSNNLHHYAKIKKTAKVVPTTIQLMGHKPMSMDTLLEKYPQIKIQYLKFDPKVFLPKPQPTAS